jgi:B9 domain-containing protein 1
MSTDRFTVVVRGEVQSGLFAEQVEACTVKYSLTTSSPEEWVHVGGECMQMSPCCRPRQDTVVWNIPIDCTFTARTPMGWPSLCLSVFGSDWFGREYVLGYGSVLVPSMPGRYEREVRLVSPRSQSIVGRVIGWLTGKRPSLINGEEFLTNYKPNRESVVLTDTGGSVRVVLNVIVTDGEKLGFVFGP